MPRMQFHLAKSALLMITLALAGCTQTSLVGKWEPEAGGKEPVFRFFSDGTGDVTERRAVFPLTWRYEANHFVLSVATGFKRTAVVREDGTLAVSANGLAVEVLRRAQ